MCICLAQVHLSFASQEQRSPCQTRVLLKRLRPLVTSGFSPIMKWRARLSSFVIGRICQCGCDIPLWRANQRVQSSDGNTLDKFPEDYVFVLSKKELHDLWS